MVVMDKSSWGDGPWQQEPDRVEFRHAGLPCLLKRSDMSGAWCGYVAVPPGHPAHGVKYDNVEVDVHGGLTYGRACEGSICHDVPQPGEPDAVWWLGFDCNHAYDYAPAMEMRFSPGLRSSPGVMGCEYRPQGYAEAQTKRLAEQLAAMA